MTRNRFIMFMLVVMLALTGCAAAETVDIVPVPTPEAQKIPLSVNGYELTYDDIMREGVGFYLPEDEFSVSENAVVFTKLLEETAYPLFTMYVYSDEGDIHTVLWSEAGNIVPVSFVYAPVPEGLVPESAQLFELDAEEAVNMLIATLELHKVPTDQEKNKADKPTVVELEDYLATFTFKNHARLRITAQGNQAQFLLPLEDGTELLAYTLDCGAEQGSIVIPYEDDTGAKVMVAFTMCPLPDDLTPAIQTLFYQAQETVNEVLATLQLSRMAD